MGIASLVFGIISIVVGLIAFGIQFLGIVENLFYLTIVGMGSGIGLFIVGGLLFQKYNNDRKKEKTTILIIPKTRLAIPTTNLNDTMN